MIKNQFYSIDDIAQILQVSYMTVYRWVRAGKLKAYQIQKQYRISTKDLQYFIERGEKVDLTPISRSLSKFIGSGMMDYSYVESKKFPINLSLGVNPLGCSPLVTSAFHKTEMNFSKYPEVVSASLRLKLGQVYNFRPDEILIGTGISELLHVCFMTFVNPDEMILMPENTFPAFEFLTILTHGQSRFISSDDNYDLDYQDLNNKITPRTKLVVLCNPNNPTGMPLNVSKIESSIKKNPSLIFVIDEANIDFGGKSMLSLVKKYSNLLVLRSFSKGFGLAGLRMGMIFGRKDLIYAMQRRQTPFAANVVGQKLAEVALDDLDFLEKSRKFMQGERHYLETELGKLGYEFVKSDSNYLLMKITLSHRHSKDFIKDINKSNANAMDGEDFRGLNGEFVRLSPRLRPENQAFVEVVRKMIGTKNSPPN